MANARLVEGVKNINRSILQRFALFFLSLSLIFGLIEPGLNTAFALSSSNPSFSTNYKLSPLSSESQAPETILTENTGETLDKTGISNPHERKYEEVEKRTPFSSTYVNNDGTRVMEYSSRQQNYRDGNTWKKLDNRLKAVQQKSYSSTQLQMLNIGQSKFVDSERFDGRAGNTSVSLKSLAQGITIESEGRVITMRPDGARNVKPIQTSDSTVLYREAWPNVDIEYELYGETVKEIIILKNKNVSIDYTFSVNGGAVIYHPTREGELTIAGLPEEYSFSALTLSLQDRGVISEKRVSQKPTKDGSGIIMSLDKDWLVSQPSSSFPMRIDPTYSKDAQTYWMFKSDGFSCNASNCYANTGTLYDNGWKSWRSYFQFPFNNLAGKTILNATLHGYYKGGIGGDTGSRTVWMGHANCVGYNCRGTQVGAAGGVSTDFDIDFTSGLQQSVNNSDWGTVWSLWGEEGAYKSYKPYLDIVAYTVYDTPTAMATPTSPNNKQVVVSTQPSLKVDSVNDADGDTVQYYFRVSTKPDAETGAIINSGWIDSPQWTMPEGILQDGTTYYWHTYIRGATQTNPNWVRSFKVDLRTGKDSTQSYETVGPVGIDLATGNATTSAGTHTMSALGGEIGLELTYNTPNRAKQGLKAELWNLPASYNFANGAPTSSATISRRDRNIDFNWGTTSPSGGINADWFYSRWTGQFVAPSAGTYKFGGSNDDNMKITINGQVLYNQGCYTGVCYDESKTITLAAGQTVPIRVDFMDATSLAYARVYVKGAVVEQVVPGEWLYTDVTNEPQSYGLSGRYYADNGDKNIDIAATDPSRLIMARNDTNLNLNFGSGGPAQGLRTDNFLVRWTGYITAPVSGTYKLGMIGDDGSRIKIKNGTSWTTVLDSWSYTNMSDRWGSAVSLSANVPVPITIDYSENTGPASFTLRVQDTTGYQMNIPTKWLTPSANVLPEQWKVGIDVGGSVSYERLRVTENSAVLEDSTGSTHEYQYTNGGYKPPVNEDGTLTRNGDNTFTFIDVDGRIYIFDASGNLTSLTSPGDDKKPTALKYEYAGDPSRLIKITDGVSSERYASIIYKGVNDTGNICDPNSATNSPTTFFGLFAQFDQAPNGMICALMTSEGSITNLYYKNSNLARIVRPGGDITDYAYDSMSRISTIRDPLAADAIGASVREDNDSVTTQLSYDSLGRINSIKKPSATNNGPREERKVSYVPSYHAPLIRYISTSNYYHYASTAKELNGHRFEYQYGNVFTESRSGTIALYSCMVGSVDQMVSKDINCEGQAKLGLMGYVYDPALTKPANSLPVYRCRIGSDHFISSTSNCEGQIVEFLLGYTDTGSINGGGSVLNIIGSSEPLGYTRRLEYDSLLRTSRDTDITGKTTVSEWDDTKDLLRSITDPTGMKSTTIYDTDDRVTDTYGPAPSAWFDTSTGVPLASYVSQTPHVGTAYDEELKGPAVTWYNLKSANMTFSGAPKAYSTGFASNNAPELGNPAYLRHDYRAQQLPFTVEPGSEGYGFTATGKLRFSQSGTYTFTAASDDSIRLFIDDQQVLSNWGTKTSGDIRNTISGSLSLSAGKVYRFNYQYGHEGMSDLGSMGLDIAGPGISGSTRDWTPYLQPGYNLSTSSIVYDNLIGNITNKTQYSNAAYGQVSGVTLDPGGLNYTGNASYEAPGIGYLRQTSKTLPGGAATNYQHYTADDTRDNPCTTETEAYHQAGMPKGSIDPTGRSSESIYNELGDIVAIRYNDDPWTCIEYDNRGRVVSNVVPSANGKDGRSLINNYAVSGNPLITSSVDSSGTITVEVDLLGRMIRYVDTSGNTTTNTYDTFGRITNRLSLVGEESYEYDSYGRLIKQKLDGITFSTITYDAFSRVDRVDYPGGMSLLPATRDSLGRINKLSYSVNSQVISDEITRSTSGLVVSGNENGVSKSYIYDKADRLTAAAIGSDTFSYGFGTADSSCSVLGDNNPNAAKDGNRTSYTHNGQVTTYCYNIADQLIASSDPRFSQASYDSHGNTTRLGDDTHKTEFMYDIGDRNTGIKETTAAGDRETTYERDASSRIYHRIYKVNGSLVDDSYYGFTGSSDSPSFLKSSDGSVTQKYLNLVGGVKVTINPQSTSAGATTYSLSNIQGNTMATVNADSTVSIIAPNGPFGEVTASHVTPENAAKGTSNDFLGINRKATEVDYLIRPVQMGARVYIPELGRFLQIDQVEGGTLNAYVYALDPVNQSDSGGKLIFIPIMIFTVIAIASIAVAATSVHTAIKEPTPPNITIAVIDVVGAGATVVSGGTSLLGAKTIGTAVRAGASAASKKGAQAAINNAAGKQGERIALERLKAQYGKEFEFRTRDYVKVDGFNRGRFPDITAHKNGDAIFYVEVKTGNARYGGAQLMKDNAIMDQYGVPTVLMRITLTGK